MFYSVGYEISQEQDRHTHLWNSNLKIKTAVTMFSDNFTIPVFLNYKLITEATRRSMYFVTSSVA